MVETNLNFLTLISVRLTEYYRVWLNVDLYNLESRCDGIFSIL